MSETMDVKPANFGLWGFILGVASLLVILIQLSAILEPQPQSAGSVIGEIAADIKQSAARAMRGEPAPAPTPAPPDNGPLFTYIALGAAGVAMVLGAFGLFRCEPRQLPMLAIGIGFSAIVMHYVFLLALVICGMILLTSIITNLDSILN